MHKRKIFGDDKYFLMYIVYIVEELPSIKNFEKKTSMRQITTIMPTIGDTAVTPVAAARIGGRDTGTLVS